MSISEENNIDGYAALDQRFNLLVAQIRKASTEKEVSEVFAKVETFWASLLGKNQPNTDMQVFFQVSELLALQLCEKETWRWIERFAETASDARKVALRIAFLEGIPEEPRRMSDLVHLWTLWRNDRARWAVYIAYNTVPERIAIDHERFASTVEGYSAVCPSLSQEELQRWTSLS